MSSEQRKKQSAAPDDLEVLEEQILAALQLDHPGPAPHDAGDPAHDHVPRVVHRDPVPVRPVLPAVVFVGVLRSVVDHDAATEDLHLFRVPHIQAAEHDRTGGQVNRLAAPDVNMLPIDAGAVIPDSRLARLRRVGLRGVGEQIQDLGIGVPIARPGDRELHRPGDSEAEGAALAPGTDPVAPRLHLDTLVPITVRRGRDRYFRRTREVEVRAVITRHRMRDRHSHSIDGDGKSVRANLGGQRGGPLGHGRQRHEKQDTGDQGGEAVAGGARGAVPSVENNAVLATGEGARADGHREDDGRKSG
jgi:hypothetical protein